MKEGQSKNVEIKDIVRWTLEAGVVIYAIGIGGFVRLTGILGGGYIAYNEIQNRRKK